MSTPPDLSDPKTALERGPALNPRFDDKGLIAAVATHAKTGEVLMLAWMNREALDARDQRGPLFQPLAGRPLEKGRNLGPGADGGGDPHRL